MKDLVWINSKLSNITIKINDLCNMKCIHCFSCGKDRAILDIKGYESSFFKLFELLYEKGIRSYDIAVIGGEIALLGEDKLFSIVKSLYEVVFSFLEEKNSKEDALFFSINLISNFVFDIKNKTSFIDLFYVLSDSELVVPKLNELYVGNHEINVVTSFDVGLDRFAGKNMFSVWRKNCEDFKGDLELLVTLNKETCKNISSILEDNFFKLFKKIIFQPMLNFSDKFNLVPDYKLAYDTVNYINANNFEKRYLVGNYSHPANSITINNDGVLSCSVSEEVKLYSEKKNIHISEINGVDLSLMLAEQFRERIKKTRNKICLGCNYFEDCNFGFAQFEKGIYCPAFKISPDVFKDIGS